MHILSNISRSKGNQTMKRGQLAEYNRNIFLRKLWRKWSRVTSSRPFFISQKSLTWGRSKCSETLFQYISIVCNYAYNKNKPYKTLDYWSRDMLDFNFSEKGLGLISQPYFVYDFSWKMFLLLHSINWPTFTVWLLLLLEMLGNMCITIVC